MNTSAKVAAQGSLFSIPAAMIVMYWAWALFPSWLARLAGFVLFVAVLAPVAAACAAATSSYSSRYGHKPVVAAIVALLTGVAAFYIEATLLYFIYPKLFGRPFSTSNLFPGLVTGAIVGYARAGAARGKAV